MTCFGKIGWPPQSVLECFGKFCQCWINGCGVKRCQHSVRLCFCSSWRLCWLKRSQMCWKQIVFFVALYGALQYESAQASQSHVKRGRNVWCIQWKHWELKKSAQEIPHCETLPGVTNMKRLSGYNPSHNSRWPSTEREPSSAAWLPRNGSFERHVDATLMNWHVSLAAPRQNVCLANAKRRQRCQSHQASGQASHQAVSHRVSVVVVLAACLRAPCQRLRVRYWWVVGGTSVLIEYVSGLRTLPALAVPGFMQ